MARNYVFKTLVAAILPMLIMLSSGLALYYALQESLDTSDRLAKHQSVLTDAHTLTLKFMDAETGERGFIITGKDEFLLPYEQALNGFRATLRQLKERVAGQPDQVTRLEMVGALFEQWNQEAAIPAIQARREGGDPERIVSSEAGKRLMDLFRAEMVEFNKQVSERLEQSRQESVTIAQRAYLITVLGLGSAVIVFVILWVILINRTSLAINGMTNAARLVMAGQLSHRAPVVGQDELATMAQAFNQMAAKLEAQSKTENEARQYLADRVEALVAERTHELLAMNDMVELLQSCHTVNEAVQVTRSLLPDLFPNSTGDLLVYDETDRLTVAVRWGAGDEALPEFFQDQDCWALRRGRAHQTEIAEHGNSLMCRHVAVVKGYHVCLPLTAQGTTFGVLHVGFDTRKTRERESRHQYVATVADQLSISFANLSLRESLQQQSVRDPLTGLYNRRYLEETVERELGRAQREQKPLSVIMLDLDYFKTINDEHGHSAGDKVLVNVANLLGSHLRGEDLICRFGGEEFTIILPGAPMEVAEARAEQLRELIQASPVALGEEGQLLVTASLGIATFPDHGADMAALIDAADDALYEAKENGRNRVVIAGQDQPSVQS